MTVALDSLIRVGDVAIAAVVECSTRAIGAAVHGSKRPLAVLVRRHGATSAFGIDGAPIAMDAFEQRFPGRRAEFERQIANASDGPDG